MIWRGRLAVQIEAPQAASFSAAFELTGNATTGELTLFTPIGTTAAQLNWSPLSATLKAQGAVQQFDSIDRLITQTVGTELPVEALFAWLSGNQTTVAGWRADLSQHAKGRITAHRTSPSPAAELRLVLEK